MNNAFNAQESLCFTTSNKEKDERSHGAVQKKGREKDILFTYLILGHGEGIVTKGSLNSWATLLLWSKNSNNILLHCTQESVLQGAMHITTYTWKIINKIKVTK